MPPFMGGIEKIIRGAIKRRLYFYKKSNCKSMPPFMGGIEKIIRGEIKRRLYFYKAPFYLVFEIIIILNFFAHFIWHQITNGNSFFAIIANKGCR